MSKKTERPGLTTIAPMTAKGGTDKPLSIVVDTTKTIPSNMVLVLSSATRFVMDGLPSPINVQSVKTRHGYTVTMTTTPNRLRYAGYVPPVIINGTQSMGKH